MHLAGRQSKTLEREGNVEEELNTLPAASIRLADTHWWTLEVQPSALGSTVPASVDPVPDNHCIFQCSYAQPFISMGSCEQHLD